MIFVVLDCIKFKLFVMLLCHMRTSFSMSLLYHAYAYLKFLILACTQKEIARLKRELRDAQDAFDILKKAINIDKNIYCPDIGDIRAPDSIRTVRIELFIKDIL